jgi:hypothetical protein
MRRLSCCNATAAVMHVKIARAFEVVSSRSLADRVGWRPRAELAAPHLHAEAPEASDLLLVKGPFLK